MGIDSDRITEGDRSRGGAPSPTHARILRVLALTRRPLLGAELQNALGLLAREAAQGCRWLADRGYIAGSTPKERPLTGRVSWRLSARGRSWLKASGVVIPRAVVQMIG